MCPERSGRKIGGPSKATQAAQAGLVNAQTSEAQSLTNLSNTALSNYSQQTAPLVNYDTSLVNAANSGDYSKLIQAAGPATGTISTQAAQARSNILQNIPAGPGRDAALANLPAQTGNAVASTLNSTYTNALQQLAGIGTQSASIGLQGAGGALSGLQGASSANQALGSMQAQASPWNIVASLAGGVGQAASGTNLKAKGAGGAGAAGADAAGAVADPLAAIA